MSESAQRDHGETRVHASECKDQQRASRRVPADVEHNQQDGGAEHHEIERIQALHVWPEKSKRSDDVVRPTSIVGSPVMRRVVLRRRIGRGPGEPGLNRVFGRRYGLRPLLEPKRETAVGRVIVSPAVIQHRHRDRDCVEPKAAGDGPIEGDGLAAGIHRADDQRCPDRYECSQPVAPERRQSRHRLILQTGRRLRGRFLALAVVRILDYHSRAPTSCPCPACRCLSGYMAFC